MAIQVNSNPISDVISSYRNNKNLSTAKQTATLSNNLGDADNIADFSSDTFEVFSIWHDTAAFYDVRDIAVSDISKMSTVLYEGGAISLAEHGALSGFKADSANLEGRIDLVEAYGDKLAEDFENDNLMEIGAKRNVMEHLKKLDVAKTGAIDIVA